MSAPGSPLAAPRPPLRALLRVVAGVLSFLSVLLLAACGQIWKPLEPPQEGAGPGREERPPPPPAAQGAEEEPVVVLAGTLEDRYPNVRFLEHEDGTWSAFVALPMGTADQVIQQLQGYCQALTREESPATLQKLQGGVMAGKPATSPTDQSVSWKPVEDVLHIRGREEDMDEILSRVDFFFNAAPQIEIKAVIYELTDTSLFERGSVPVGSAPFLQNLGTVQPTGEGPFLRALGGAFPTGTGQSMTTGPGGVFQIAILQNQLQLQALIQVLSSLSNADVVSSPSVVVRNGVAAKLASTEKIPVLEPTSVGAQGVTNQKITWKDVGVTLQVVPSLMGADTIHLVIHAEASRVGREVVLSTSSGGEPIFSPIISSRTADTAVMLRAGETVVIGGLKLREQRSAKSKVPILGDIPVLDWVFSSRTEEEVETEVLFMITPEVKARPSISPLTTDIFDPFAETE